MSCFLPSCPMWQQLAKRCNDTVVSRLPSQMSSAVALTKFLSDWCERLIHPSSLRESFLFYLPLLTDWIISPTEGLSRSSSNPTPKHIAGRTGTCPSSMSCPSICEAIQITSIAKKQMQVPISDPCEKTGLSAMFIMAKDQINEECLLRNGESWESLSLADTSNLVARRVLVADASVWRPILVEVPLCGKNEHIMPLGHDFTTEVWHCPEFQILSFRSWRGISATSGWMGVAGLKSLGVASSSQAANDDTSWMKSKKPVACERYFSDQVRVTTVREPCSSQFLLLPRVKSMLKAQKAWAWQTSSHRVFGKIVWLLLLSDGFQESLRYQESCCLFQFRARMSRALNNFCRAGRITSTRAS